MNPSGFDKEKSLFVLLRPVLEIPENENKNWKRPTTNNQNKRKEFSHSSFFYLEGP